MRYILCCLFLLCGCKSGPQNVILNGYVEGEFRLLAPTQSGTVAQIKAQKGAYVKKGDVLALIENTDSKLTVAQNQAAFDLAKITLERISKLEKQNAVSKAELDNAQTNFDKAKAALEISQWHLSKDVIYAPEDGYVQNILKYEGEITGPPSPIVYFLPENGIKVRFFVPEKMLGALKLGQMINAKTDDGALKQAIISFISNKPEFNPPVLYSEKLREKMLFMIEGTLTSPYSLKPGQPIDIILESPAS